MWTYQKKERVIAEADLDGTYVLTGEALEQSDKVKLFEHFIYEIAVPLRRLYEIRNNSIGVIELSAALDIDATMEIISRMNRTNVHLHTMDFIRSRMAAINSL